MYRHNKKYKSLITTTKDLFWKYGYRRVSLEEICREAKVSKMTFYKFFKNKEEIARVILDNIFEESMRKFHEVWDSGLPIEERFKMMLLMKAEATKNLSVEFIKDLYSNPDSELSSYMSEKSMVLFEEMKVMYKKAQVDGWIRKDLNIDFFFYFMQQTIGIMEDPQAQQYFENSQDLIMEITRFFLYGMHPKPEDCD